MNLIKRLILDDNGMEMIEWAIVGMIFAVAAAAASWATLTDSVEGALLAVSDEVTPAA